MASLQMEEQAAAPMTTNSDGHMVRDVPRIDEDNFDNDVNDVDLGDLYSIRSMQSATPLGVPRTIAAKEDRHEEDNKEEEEDDDDDDDDWFDSYSIRSMKSATPLPVPLSSNATTTSREDEPTPVPTVASQPKWLSNAVAQPPVEQEFSPPPTRPSAPVPRSRRDAAFAATDATKTTMTTTTMRKKEEKETLVRRSSMVVQGRDYAAGLTVGVASCLCGGVPLWAGVVAGLGVTCAAVTQVPGTLVGDASRSVGDVAWAVQRRVRLVLSKSEEEEEYVLVPLYSPEWMDWQEGCRAVQASANRMSRVVVQWAQWVGAKRQEQQRRRRRQGAQNQDAEAEELKRETVESRNYFTAAEEHAFVDSGGRGRWFAAQVT